MSFTRHEQALVQRLGTPVKVQRYLESLPYNFEPRGETLRSFRGVMRAGRAHCLEAALTAATILEHHGHPPLLMDLESVDLLDHVLFVYRGKDGRYGSIARSRDPGLHGRKPLFASLRDLARSYVLPYIDATGRIHGYGVLDLRELRRVDWRFAKSHLWSVERALNDNAHKKLATSTREYETWRARYLAYKARYPERRPTYYPDRHTWL